MQTGFACLLVKIKRRGSEREEETKERFEPPGNNPSPLSLFLSIVLAVVLRFFFFFFRSSSFSFCTRHQRRRATSTRSAISRRRPNRSFFHARSIPSPALPREESFHGFLRKHETPPLRASITTVSPANSSLLAARSNSR